MAEIGKVNKLQVARAVEFGVYLDGRNLGEILLPNRYVSNNCNIGDEIEVFIYLDSEDRLVATTETPYVTVDDFALLRVAAVNKIGAFMDWGLQKDLLVPYREQRQNMKEGRSYLVYVYLDEESNRIAASTKIHKYVDQVHVDYEEGEEVDLIIYRKEELGFKVIINKTHFGMIYDSEIFQTIHVGQKMKGYIKQIREDEKIDCKLQKIGYDQVNDFSTILYKYIKSNEGFIPINDKSSADDIRDTFGVSKKTFKKAVGALYKQRIITITEKGIQLL
ncbi:GntR family transcriptional regulator [Puteibacter caeruleilacunae]|nr:GntR family transcriptional regulator [Puteibacter caeruleilacunae]